MRRYRLLTLSCFFALVSCCGIAHADPPAPLTVERIYDSGEFNEQSIGATWLDTSDASESAYSVLEAAQGHGGGREIVRYDAASGDRRVLVSASELTPPGKGTPLSVEGHAWSQDRSRLLIFTNSARVWRRNTRGDYWVLDRASGQLVQLAKDAAPQSLMYAKLSPDGQSVAYVRDGNVYVERLVDHSIRCLTRRENDRIFNGMSDWVYEEEFGLRDAFRWSPDGKRIAYWRFDTSGVDDFTMINNTDALYPTTKVFAYPKAGTLNSEVRIAVVDVSTGETRMVELPGDPRQNYLPEMQWVDGTGELLIRQMNRLQNRESFTLVNFDSKTKRNVFTETDDRWIDLQPPVKFLADSDSFLYLSDRDGWRHLYQVSVGEPSVKRLTHGEYDIVELVSVVDAKTDHAMVYFIASPDAATERYLYVYSFADQSTRRVTPQDNVGTHSYTVSPNGRYAIHRYSNANTPPVVDLVSLPEHESVRGLVSNEKLVEKLATLAPVETEFFQVDLGDVVLDGWRMEPPEMDPSKKYPLLVHVYGEPAGTTVVNRWGGKNALWHRMFAERGYVVISIDNRGTNCPRGCDFRKSVYRLLGTLGPNDQAAAVQKLLETDDQLDPRRVGMWGWSGGGTSTLNALFKFPKLYRTGVAIAPVANLSYYDTIYEERYMGLPTDNVDGYRSGSPIHYVDQFQGKLLLIHGTADDNVHYQATELLVNKLIEAGKQFDFFVYPGRSHSISEGKNTRLHLMTMITDYLRKNLPAGPRD